MAPFQLDATRIAASKERADMLGATPEAERLLARVRDGSGLDCEAWTALFLSPRVATATLFEIARERRAERSRHLETFAPLYVSNECDAECAMCGMRSFNDKLRRETADAATVEQQLDILRRRGLRGIALLTGEYRHGSKRRAMIQRASRALGAALDRGFTHVLVNIGALEDDEYDELLAEAPRAADGRIVPKVTMCTFQETYHPSSYAKFMGTTPENPRSDFGRRLRNFDRAADAGMWSVNPGVLLGLNQDLGFELLALLAHFRHLRERGLAVYASLPRLRKASGAPHVAGVDDDGLVRFAATLALAAPDVKVVVSTREPPAIQQRLLPVVGVLTPGSPGVAPYTADGARFELEASQFEVLDHRPFEQILGDLVEQGIRVDCFEPGRPG
ncbi:MAG: hypothetical protein ACR2P8_01790 [Myxococcota bacterium]